MNNLLSNDKDTNFDAWYTEVCLKSELMIHGVVKGTISLDEYGLLLWNRVKSILKIFLSLNNLNIKEIKLSSLIPSSLLREETEHFNGFLPESLKITHIGGREFNDPLILRPTSEVLFSKFFQLKLKNYKDLPMQYIQWCNVFRWENNTKPFIRNCEFYWHEGHTLHETQQDLNTFIDFIKNIYGKLIKNYLLLDVYSGMKTSNEKFFGANETFTYEAFMPNGNAIQCATVHDLSSNFSSVYGIKFQAKNNQYSYPVQTSWGFSTRLLGAMIMNHADNNGLIMPSKLSPFKIAIVKYTSINQKQKLFSLKKNNKLTINDSKVYIELIKLLKNNAITYTESFTKKESILKGVPIIIELNDNSIETDIIRIISRIDLNIMDIKLDSNTLAKKINELLINSDTELYNRSVKNLEKMTDHIEEDAKILECIQKGKIIKTYFCGSSDEEKEIINNKYKLSIRCILRGDNNNKCIFCSKVSQFVVIISKSY